MAAGGSTRYEVNFMGEGVLSHFKDFDQKFLHFLHTMQVVHLHFNNHCCQSLVLAFTIGAGVGDEADFQIRGFELSSSLDEGVEVLWQWMEAADILQTKPVDAAS